MAESELVPHTPQFAPKPIKDLKEGETKYWCRCGLSKNQPWCDGSHEGTGIAPLAWKVEGGKDTYYVCCCKQTKTPPLCDGTHSKIKDEVPARQSACAKKDGHVADCKLCTKCGWAPDF